MYAVIIILLIVSLACFLVGAATGHAVAPDGRPAAWARTNYMSLGLALWVLVTLLTVLHLV